MPQFKGDRSKMRRFEPFLDPNHTHFILVDDGSDSMFGVEISFRAKLEAELRKGYSLSFYEDKRMRRNSFFRSSTETIGSFEENSEIDITIPMILIVVQGGPNTLKTVFESIEKEVPILILVVSFKYFFNL